MDTIIFAVILATALVMIFKPKRWLVLSGFALSFVLTGYLFAHHVTSSLDLSF